MTKDSVLFDLKNGVLTITFNEPENMNVATPGIVSGLKKAVHELNTNPEVRAGIITANGKAFSAGGNLKGFPEQARSNASLGRVYMQEAHEIVRGLALLEKPLIAAVNGLAVGAGFSKALLCDFIIASEKAKFSMAFSKVGLVPDFAGLHHLPRFTNIQRAKELLFTGRMITAQEAKEYNIVLEVVPEDELLSRAQKFAEQLAQGPTAAIAMAKSILNRAYETSLEHSLQEEAMAQGIAFTTADHQEGINAFFENRQPEFKGE